MRPQARVGPRRGRRWDLARRCLIGATVAAALWTSPLASAAAAPLPARRAIVLFLPAQVAPAAGAAQGVDARSAPSTARLRDQTLLALARRSSLSLGLLSATQGDYSPQQALLDMTQGTRVSASTYDPFAPPTLTLVPVAAGALVAGWPTVLERAASAPQTIDPGLLAGTIPGGAGYAGPAGASQPDAALAADRAGQIARVNLGPASTLVARTLRLSAGHGLVVADLPAGSAGLSALDALLARRTPAELVIVVQTPPASSQELLPIGIADGRPARELTSGTTTLDGIVAGIDLAPTVLRWLGLSVPSDMRGQPIRARGVRDAAALTAFARRLDTIEQRRLPALQVMLLAWVTVLFALAALRGWRWARGYALRWGGLAILWLPTTVLVAAAVSPAQAWVESTLIVAGAFALAALGDSLLPWPRGPLLPAAVGLVLITVDVARGSPLTIRSLLGPNPELGSRFFGIGNELKSGLVVLMLAGLAAALGTRPRSRQLAGAIVACGVALGVVMGSGRLGAGVGGVIIVAAATAVAAVVALPTRRRTRTLAVVVISPLLALAALAVLDLLTSGGRGHLSHDVLHAHGLRNLEDIVARRYALAWHALLRGGMPIVTLICCLAVTFAWRNRWLYDRAPGPAWHAALLGGLAGGIAGALTEDSGPLLFVVATFVLAALTAYLRGDPRLQRRGPTTRPGHAPTRTFVQAMRGRSAGAHVGPTHAGR